jgi:3-dehydroquinate synthase II
MKKIILNFDVKGKNFSELVQEAFNLNFVDFLISETTFSDFKNIQRINTYSFDSEINANNLIFFHSYEIPSKVKKVAKIGLYKEILSKQDETEIIEDSKKSKVNFVIAKAKNWKIIPFENLIAELHKTDIELIASVDNIEEAELMLKTLQIGTDGILFKPERSDDIIELKRFLLTEFIIELNQANVINIQTIAESERVCVDTTSLLKEGEGMLIGSTAKGFVLVHAEVFETQFVSSRPFRVNAGDVSAYILVPSDKENEKYKTKYLSELKGGDKVIITNYNGETRIVTVGRVKIETRPMLRFELEFKRDNKKIKVNYIGQNAETIRLIKPDGTPISVVDIRIGDEVLIHLGPGATHFGTAIDENIMEK